LLKKKISSRKKRRKFHLLRIFRKLKQVLQKNLSQKMIPKSTVVNNLPSLLKKIVVVTVTEK
jgi:hypothetical protein